MESLKSINQDKLEVIANLSIKGVMNLIDNIVKKYYLAYINNDADKCKSTLSFIHDIVYMFEDDVDLLEQYVNYCMLNNANFIVATLFERDIELNPFVEVEVQSNDGFNGLKHAIRDSLNMKIDNVDKVNIKYLHDRCVVGGTIDEDILDSVTALYDSFNSKSDASDNVGGVV